MFAVIGAQNHSTAALFASVCLLCCTELPTTQEPKDSGTVDQLLKVEEMGGSLGEAGVSRRSTSIRCARLAVDSTGSPHVAWEDSSFGTSEIYLRKWTGQAWEGLGGSDVDGGLSQGGFVKLQGYGACLGQIRFDAQGRLWVAYMHFLGTSQPLYVKYWDGTSWRGTAGSASGGGLSQGSYVWWPAMEFDAQGRVIVAWSQSTTVYVLRSETTQWLPLGGAAASAQLAQRAEFPQLAVHRSGDITVAWTGNWSNYGDIRVAQFSAGSWRGLGDSNLDGGISHSGLAWGPSLMLDDADRPWVTWSEFYGDGGSDVLVRRWTGQSWEAPGNLSSFQAAGIANSTAQYPSLIKDAQQRMYVLWGQQDAVGHNIHLARFENSGWRQFELGDAGAGITKTDGFAEYAAVQFLPNGDAFALWQQPDSDGVNQVRMAKLSFGVPPAPVSLEPRNYRVTCEASPVGLGIIGVLAGLAFIRTRRGRDETGHASRELER
jgi:hypothetical protein